VKVEKIKTVDAEITVSKSKSGFSIVVVIVLIIVSMCAGVLFGIHL